MNIVSLLQSLGRECETAVKGLKLPTAVQKGDTKIIKREPEIHLMRLPKSSDVYKIAPYIIVRS